jgi:hypothetical protein
MRRYYAAIFCLSLSLATACQAAAQASQPTNSKAATQPASVAPRDEQFTVVPAFMSQCEADQCTRGGGGAIWVFEGKHGQAMWRFGAIADLTVVSYDGHTIAIHREDPNPSYSSPRFADRKKRPDGVLPTTWGHFRGTALMAGSCTDVSCIRFGNTV